MKRNFLLHILALSGLLAISCREVAMECDSEYPEGDGQYLSIMVDTPDIRTRAVDLNPGAALFLKNIWVGIYDRSTGARVGGTLTKGVELDRLLTASGNTLIDLVKIEINANVQATNNNRYCVVGVANYDDIKVYDDSGKDEDIDLYDRLRYADNWEKFINIAIDTDKSKFENQVPLLVGYLHKESVGSANIKVDQFSNSNQPVKLSDISDDVFVSPKLQTTGGRTYFNGINTKYGDNQYYVLKLRRLRSKINVVINEEPVPGVTVTNLQYKICNVPKSAFLAQRRTNSFGAGMNVGVAYSPNSADVLTNGRADGYFDTDYMSPQVNTNFSFEHFENLHWARYTEGLKEYHDREKKEDNDAFSALATSPDEWNNRATYFVLKMNIRDDNLGRNAEVEYTIHEGFCNDENGNSLVNDAGVGNLSQRLLDFACVRNTDYYYKITVNSIKEIFVQVTDSNQHTTDQQGKIWDIDYVNQTPGSRDPEPYESDKEIVVNEGLVLKTTDDFNNAKDIAFRFVGTYYDTDRAVEVPVDICYNFKRGDLDGFVGLWNAPTNESSEYIVATDESDDRSAYQALIDFCNGSSENAAHFKRLIGEIQVKYGGVYYNIIDYLGQVTGDDNPNPDIQGFKFSGLKYYEAYDEANDNKRNHLRGLYIFDVQKAVVGGERVQADKDGCTLLYKINGIEQLPKYLEKENEKYEMIYVTSNNGQSNPVGPRTNAKYESFRDGHNGTGMLLSEHPDLAFRLLGFDDNGKKYVDLLYNFTQNEYTYFADNNLWPALNLNGIYSTTIPKGALGAETIPSFLDGLKVIYKGVEYGIYDFVTGYERGTIQLSGEDKLFFSVSPYDLTVNTSTQAKYMRALYLFDRKNKFVKPALLSADEESVTFQAYAVEQKPSFAGQLQLALPNLTNNYYSSTAENFVTYTLEDYISIPRLEDIDPSEYKYKIIIKSGNKQKECIVDVAPDADGNFNYSIPMKAIPGSDCTVHLQAISTSDRYSDSVTKQIGSITLKNTINWDFTSSQAIRKESRWQDLWKDFGGTVSSESTNVNGAKYYYYEFTSDTKNFDGYLDFYSSGSSKHIRGYYNPQTSGYPAACVCLYNSGPGCDLKFRVYKNCKITVRASSRNTSNGLLSVSGGSPLSREIVSNTSYNNSYDFTVDLGAEDYKDITIYANGNGANIYSIKLSDL